MMEYVKNKSIAARLGPIVGIIEDISDRMLNHGDCLRTIAGAIENKEAARTLGSAVEFVCSEVRLLETLVDELVMVASQIRGEGLNAMERQQVGAHRN